MSAKTTALLGATGMIGSYLLEQLLNDSYFGTIRVIVRRPLIYNHPKIEVKLVDFNDYESLKLAIDGSDALFCAIGTTQKNVKRDQELYRKIDFDIPAKAAKICKETGCRKFIIVTSIGANSSSRSFYLRLKGDVENAILENNPGAIHILQPSMLLGDRKEKRSAENLLQGTMKMISGLLAGPFRKYKAIHGKIVAAAMLQAAKKDVSGVYRYRYDDMIKLSGEK